MIDENPNQKVSSDNANQNLIVLYEDTDQTLSNETPHRIINVDDSKKSSSMKDDGLTGLSEIQQAQNKNVYINQTCPNTDSSGNENALESVHDKAVLVGNVQEMLPTHRNHDNEEVKHIETIKKKLLYEIESLTEEKQTMEREVIKLRQTFNNEKGKVTFLFCHFVIFYSVLPYIINHSQ